MKDAEEEEDEWQEFEDVAKDSNRETNDAHKNSEKKEVEFSQGFGGFGTFNTFVPTKVEENSLKIGAIGKFPKLPVLDGDDFEVIKKTPNEEPITTLGFVEQPAIFIKPQANRKNKNKLDYLCA